MTDNTRSSHKEKNAQNQLPEDFVRQGYHVRVSGGQEFIVPNALEDVEISVAAMHKPDYSMAVDMPGGVSVASIACL